MNTTFDQSTEAAIRAHFTLGRVLDDVLDDPFATDAEPRLSAATWQAHETAHAAGLLALSLTEWDALARQHPDYPLEMARHYLAEQRRAGHRSALNRLERAVDAGDRQECQAALAALAEHCDGREVLRWLGGTP